MGELLMLIFDEAHDCTPDGDLTGQALRYLADGLEVGHEVVALLLLLNASEGHLGALDVLLGVDEVLGKDLLIPGDARLLVGTGVVVPIHSAGLAAEETGQVGAGAVLGVRARHGMTLQALLLEDLSSLANVTHS